MDPVAWDDSELFKRLDNAELIDRFEKSDDWKLVREASKRASESAKEALMKADPRNQALIIELQQVAKIFGSFIPSLINTYKAEGNLAFEEGKVRGIIGRIKGIFK